VPDAANVLRIGPVLDAPPLCCETDQVDIPAGSTPLVLVSLSTSEQGQTDLLQRCVDAVGQLPVNAIVTTGPSIDPKSVTTGTNTQVARHVPHTEILPSASLVITQAGLGTTMAALGHGVPLLCTPLAATSSSTPNGSTTSARGPDADARRRRRRRQRRARARRKDIPGDSRFTTEAKHMADAISGYGGATQASTALEALA
jgi:hypothetical protein